LLHLTIPPPVVGLVSALAMYLLDQFTPSLTSDFTAAKYAAYLFFLAGLAIEGWSVWLFFRAKTTVNPLKPENSKVLVVTGMYKYTRNPMYLGMLLLLIGWLLWVGNPVGLTMLVFFVWYLTQFQIKPEERALTELFERQYTDYMHKVRRWL